MNESTDSDYTQRLETAILALWPLIPPRVRSNIRDEEPALAQFVADLKRRTGSYHGQFADG